MRAESSAHTQLDRAAARLALASRHGLRAADLRLDAAASRRRVLDPALALARGWSITRGPDGSVLRSTSDVANGDAVITTLADGFITSTITAIERAGAHDDD